MPCKSVTYLNASLCANLDCLLRNSFSCRYHTRTISYLQKKIKKEDVNLEEKKIETNNCLLIVKILSACCFAIPVRAGAYRADAGQLRGILAPT